MIPSVFLSARRPARRRAVLLAALLALLVAPPVAASAGASAPPAATGAAAAVRVRHPWFRYLLASVPAGGYVTLTNPGAAPRVLTGVSSSGCGSIMLHRTESQGGTDRMVEVGSVTIPPHGSFRFAPGGYHMMCMMPRMHPGQTVPVTLRFADGARVTVRFAVKGANGAPPMQMNMK